MRGVVPPTEVFSRNSMNLMRSVFTGASVQRRTVRKGPRGVDSRSNYIRENIVTVTPPAKINPPTRR